MKPSRRVTAIRAITNGNPLLTHLCTQLLTDRTLRHQQVEAFLAAPPGDKEGPNLPNQLFAWLEQHADQPTVTKWRELYDSMSEDELPSRINEVNADLFTQYVSEAYPPKGPVAA